MTKPRPPEARLQSLGEEIANSLSSGIGLMTVIAGIPLLVGSAPRESRYIWGVGRQVAGGLRSVVAATAQPAGTARKSG